MIIREATTGDIKQIQIIRHAVRENRLSDPKRVTDDDCNTYINKRGKGWVCELGGKVSGFAIVDLVANNVWALFVHPDLEKQGAGRLLHDTMLDWYFSQTAKDIWLSTAPKTRAEIFYRKSGWAEKGVHGSGEIKFEMTVKDWKNYKKGSVKTKPE
ncbi:Acetyltransferase (GNAT) family protein [Cnuella takakiae]|uniref:Acetyltransferase (GNAT) family protein n=1 Tax=Cnuella takakiae TaxID=1302690 RepID=A0A1M4US55_9BACT|nr:GNAT family N-acetyltransferase [Cnuella takakiae]OLY92791.1 GNAT family N-acetyltransferase [Cnuella takakiae]SHE59519.1 Acetyltransferase (GNAT) family protein [Cnuella takakiae]